MSDATIEVAGGFSLRDLAGNKRRIRRERAVRALFFTAALASVVVSALIVVSLARETWTFVTQVDWSVVWSDGWFPRRGIYDIKTLIAGSVIISVIAMLVAGPIGLGAAVYLSEYARPGVRRWLKPTLEILAGIPSVVVGFFALTFLGPEIVQRLSEAAPPRTMFAAGLGVGVLIIPLVASIAEDAMRSVPKALREAAYGMGAKKVTTTVRVVIPAAVSGLVAAFIIAISRAIGETMVVYLAAGASGVSLFQVDPFEAGTTMTAAMASVAVGTDSVVGEALTVPSLYFVGAVLFAITLSLNLVADRFVRRYRQKY